MSTAYVEIDSAKSTLSLGGETFADTDLAVAIEAASRMIDDLTGRRFDEVGDSPTSEARAFTAMAPDRVRVDDFTEASSLAVDGEEWSLDDLFLRPSSADSQVYDTILTDSSSRFPTGRGAVVLTAVYGWPAVPAAIQQATTLLANRLMKRAREAPFAVAGFGSDGAVVRVGNVDPDIRALLAPYVHQNLVV